MKKQAALIRELCSDRLKNVILGHLSKENNYPQLALETVKLEFRIFGNPEENGTERCSEK